MIAVECSEKQTKGLMRILCKDGDRRIVWRSNSIPEVSEARAAFKDAVAQGHLAFLAKKGGSRGTKITEFDPLAEEIILVPPITGG